MSDNSYKLDHDTSFADLQARGAESVGDLDFLHWLEYLQRLASSVAADLDNDGETTEDHIRWKDAAGHLQCAIDRVEHWFRPTVKGSGNVG